MTLSLVVDEHREYLADQVRLSAFCEAIGEVVKPGDVVLDLAAGTGVLGLFACRAGAKRVYSVEKEGIVDLARAVCRANGFQDRVRFMKGLSTRIELPERVDVVVADQIGRFGFEAGLLEYFDDARARFLKPDGRLIPSCVEMWVAPVECPEIFAQVEFWNDSPAGFDFRPARSWAVNTGYPVKLHSDHLLSDPVSAVSLNLAVLTPTPLRREVSVVATRAGNLHGVGGWFAAQLSKSITMTNSPLATSSINRRNVFFPIDRPVALEQGDRIRIKMQILPSELVVTWEVEVWGEAGVRKARFTHSTFQGMLLCKEDLERTQPQFVPKLSPWGEARRSILNLCDGGRTLAEIEQELYRHYPELFRSPGEAAAFVAEVVTRYSL